MKDKQVLMDLVTACGYICILFAILYICLFIHAA